MLKISDAVRSTLMGHPEQYILLKLGQLNLSAFAASVRPHIEEKTKKPVRTGTIVTALGRIQREIATEPALVPTISLHDLSLKSGLMEIVFERTKENVLALQRFSALELSGPNFLMMSHGVSELAIIAPVHLQGKILTMFAPAVPTLALTGLAGITLRFDEQYIEQSNMFYGLLRAFAVRRILIVEMVSTFTETTLLIDERDVQHAMEVLQPFLAERIEA